ncbi:hypothetical protein VTN02DRAFT_1805 [Thermoascus thermophilus]
MATQYFNRFRAKAQTRVSRTGKTRDPVLTDEDEAFLRRVVSQPVEGDSQDGSTPPVARDAQGEAQDIPPPVSQTEGERVRGTGPGVAGRVAEQESRGGAEKVTRKTRPWSWMWKKSVGGRDKNSEAVAPGVSDVPGRDSNAPSAQLTAAGDADDQEAEQEARDVTEVLERLNLAAENNRVFSIGDETRELLRRFNLVLKDLINGVPTAYHDLESLLVNGHKQLQQTYNDLPGFLKKLIKQLPDKVADTLGPELLAAAAEKAETSGVNMENVGKAAAAARKMGFKTPSLKELVGKPTAIVGMLRSIVAFLRARFPAIMGMNVLWSLALFTLLFVLWYCHKRGREVRLEQERLVTEAEIAQMNAESTEQMIRATETLTTTAPPGAAIEEVREGVREAQQARDWEAALAAAEEEGKREDDHPSFLSSPPAQPRTSSRRRTIRKGPNKIEPYPGT